MLPLTLLGVLALIAIGVLWALTADWPAPDEPDPKRPLTDTPPPGQE